MRAVPFASAPASGLVLVFWLSACSDEAPRIATLQFDTVNGIPHSVAPDAPEQGDQGLEFLWRAPGEAEVLDGAEWANPTWLAMNDGRIAVLDPQLARVHLFTPDGERSGSFGRRGEGPGELSRPTSLGIQGDSILVAGAFTSPALQWFGIDGTYLGSLGTPADGVSASAYFLPGIGVVRQVVDLEAGTGGIGWQLLDVAGDRHAIELPGDHSMQPHGSEGGAGCWRRGTAGPHLVEVDCTFPLVRVVDSRGEVLREHRVDRAPVRTPPALIDRAMEEVESSMLGSADGVPQEMINQLVSRQVERMREQYVWTPVMSRVAGSASGHRILLVEALPEDLGGGPATLHILADDGRYLARHLFEPRIRSMAASDSQLVVLLEDPETGLRWMEAYRLP